MQNLALKKRVSILLKLSYINWLRELDLNQRPSGYEPDELPDCSIPRYLFNCLAFYPRSLPDLPLLKRYSIFFVGRVSRVIYLIVLRSTLAVFQTYLSSKDIQSFSSVEYPALTILLLFAEYKKSTPMVLLAKYFMFGLFINRGNIKS